jgi:hypothetical protein
MISIPIALSLSLVLFLIVSGHKSQLFTAIEFLSPRLYSSRSTTKNSAMLPITLSLDFRFPYFLFRRSISPIAFDTIASWE